MSDPFSPLDGDAPASPSLPSLPTLPPSGPRAPFGSVAPPAPGMPPAAGFGPGPGHGAGPAYGAGYLPVTPPRKQKSRAGWWIALGVVVALVVGGGVYGVAKKVDEATSMPVESVPAAAAPADGVAATGPSGWVLQTSPSWSSIDQPTAVIESGWFTGTGTATYHNNVVITTETPKVDIDLGAYLRISERNAPNQLANGVVLSNHLFSDGAHEFGRLEFTGTVNGEALHFLTYVIKVRSKFVIVTYDASVATYASTVADVEPYLVTLAAQ